jgi:hypothetical protein
MGTRTSQRQTFSHTVVQHTPFCLIRLKLSLGGMTAVSHQGNKSAQESARNTILHCGCSAKHASIDFVQGCDKRTSDRLTVKCSTSQSAFSSPHSLSTDLAANVKPDPGTLLPMDLGERVALTRTPCPNARSGLCGCSNSRPFSLNEMRPTVLTWRRNGC